MSNPEKYAGLQHRRFTFRLYTILILGVFSLLIIASLILYPIRNAKDGAVAVRFLKQNQTLTNQLGEIRQIKGFGTEPADIGSRSREIAQELKNGEKSSEIGAARADNSQSEVIKISDDYGNIRRNGEIVGTNKTFEVEIFLESREWGDFGLIKYFTVSRTKYREKGGEWKEIQVSWLDNYLLLFK